MPVDATFYCVCLLFWYSVISRLLIYQLLWYYSLLRCRWSCYVYACHYSHCIYIDTLLLLYSDITDILHNYTATAPHDLFMPDDTIDVNFVVITIYLLLFRVLSHFDTLIFYIGDDTVFTSTMIHLRCACWPVLTRYLLMIHLLIFWCCCYWFWWWFYLTLLALVPVYCQPLPSHSLDYSHLSNDQPDPSLVTALAWLF